MPRSFTDSPDKTRYPNHRLSNHSVPITPAMQVTTYKSSIISTKVNEKTDAKHTPLKIGSKGTIGSLVRQEIEYFTRLESREGVASYVKPKLGSLVTNPNKKKKKKKKRTSSKFIPSICSMVEVVDTSRPNVYSNFTYRSLKADLRRLQV